MTRSERQGRVAATAITAFFACVWALNGTYALPGSWRPWLLALTVLITLLIFGILLSALRRPGGRAETQLGAKNPFASRSYAISVLAMFVALPVAGRLLTLWGHPGAILPAVAVIVGLHFLGLMRPFKSRLFGVIAALFCVLGLSALVLPVELAGVALRQAWVGFGCALVLWLSALPSVWWLLKR